MREFLLKLLRSITGYYKLVKVINLQDETIIDFKKLAKKIKSEAIEGLETNPCGGNELYKVALRKVVADIDTVLDYEDKIVDTDNLIVDSMENGGENE